MRPSAFILAHTLAIKTLAAPGGGALYSTADDFVVLNNYSFAPISEIEARLASLVFGERPSLRRNSDALDITALYQEGLPAPLARSARGGRPRAVILRGVVGFGRGRSGGRGRKSRRSALCRLRRDERGEAAGPFDGRLFF